MSASIVQHPTLRGKNDLLKAIGYARAALADQDRALAVLAEAVRRGVMSPREGIGLYYEINSELPGG